jgi:hypothetical protein
MRKTGTIGAALLCVAVFLAGCRTADHLVSTPPQVLARFTFDANAPAILLLLTLAGQSYPFVLDTGAVVTVCDVRLKDKLGGRFLWPMDAWDAYGNSFKVEMRPMDDASVGPLKYPRSLVTVMDMSKTNAAAKMDAAGALGMDFLQDYVLQIDLSRSAVTFLKSEKGVVRPEWGEHVPIDRPWPWSWPRVEGQVNGIQESFLLDTGFISGPHVKSGLSATALRTGLFDKIKPQMLVFTATDSIELDTIAGEKVKGGQCLLADLVCLGLACCEDVAIVKTDYSILSLSLFAPFIVTFDFPNDKLYLKPIRGEAPVKSADVRFESLGFSLMREDTRLSVCMIDPNGPAYEKGVRPVTCPRIMYQGS